MATWHMALILIKIIVGPVLLNKVLFFVMQDNINVTILVDITIVSILN
jgi:hypothetical protein